MSIIIYFLAIGIIGKMLYNGKVGQISFREVEAMDVAGLHIRRRLFTKPVRIAALVLILLAAAIILTVVSVNVYMLRAVNGRILTEDGAASLTDVDCIIVLGCKVRPDGTPSDMLRDRLDTGCALYLDGAAPKLLMSGDHGRSDYDEVNCMKSYATELGIEPEDVFMDHAGFSTYESIYRARDVFECEKVLIVSQEYHLYRALYIAEKLGIEAYGVAADPREYAGQWKRDIRELAARTKDFFMVMLDAPPAFLGEAVPISGNGDISNG